MHTAHVDCQTKAQTWTISHGGQIFCFKYFKAVIATVLKPGKVVVVLHSMKLSCPAHSQYGRGNCKYRTQLKIGHFMFHFGAPPFQVRTYMQVHLQTDFFSRRVGMTTTKNKTNGSWYLWVVVGWKLSKFVRNWPFPWSYRQLILEMLHQCTLIVIMAATVQITLSRALVEASVHWLTWMSLFY